MDEIQKLRKDLAALIKGKVIPMREKLDKLLNEEAEKICPFNIGEIIELDNGKKGTIKKINYHSLDYEFPKMDEDFYSDFLPKVDNIDYIYAYQVDDDSFSITWEISGVRMIKDDTEEGKIPFRGISPISFEIDVKNKKVSRKKLKAFLDGEEFYTEFSPIKSS